MRSYNKYIDISPSRARIVLEQVDNINEIKSVVEFGCGSGQTLLEIQNINPEIDVLGFDLYPVNNTKLSIIMSDLNNFDFDKHSVKLQNTDVFLLLDVLEHLVDPWTFLNELISRINQNSQIVIISPNFASVRMFQAYIRGNLPRKRSGFFDRTHLRWLTADCLMRELNDTQLKFKTSYVKSSKFLFYLMQCFWPTRMCSQFILTIDIDKSH
jgi:2-polyprenyl-3-methyl-5-hydroxy-6-metoxy-1,4-benzoquinol methylase